MGEKFNRFKESLKRTLSNLGSSTGNVLKNLEKTDKELNEKIKKATGSISNF